MYHDFTLTRLARQKVGDLHKQASSFAAVAASKEAVSYSRQRRTETLERLRSHVLARTGHSCGSCPAAGGAR